MQLCTKHNKFPNNVALELGFSNAAATSWKKGAVPRISTLQKIADYFGVTVEYLTNGVPVSEEQSTISQEAHHIGVLFDRADEKDKLLTHSVLDKYDGSGKIVSLNANAFNPGGFIEVSVYDEPAAAGFGNYLDAPQPSREQFPAFIVPKGTDFGIRISGNSMEPMVSDGSTVFVRQTMSVDPGRVGIFVLNGASFCKQLIVDKVNMQVRLHSMNPDYEDIIVQPSDRLVTIGQVL